MKVMVFVPANADSESGVMPAPERIGKMMAFNEKLVKAGVILDGDGLTPTSRARRVRFGNGTTTVSEGPFPLTRELVAGYWIWDVKSMDEAVEWLKQAPFDDGTEVTIRPFFTPEDFGDNLTPEMRAKEDALRAESARRKP